MITFQLGAFKNEMMLTNSICVLIASKFEFTFKFVNFFFFKYSFHVHVYEPVKNVLSSGNDMSHESTSTIAPTKKFPNTSDLLKTFGRRKIVHF